MHHVALETRREDADACAAFYALLGFTEVEPPQSLRERALWVERDGRQIHLLFADDPVIPPEGHIAVVADPYAATLERLRSAGHAVEDRAEHWGSPRALVADPAGHRVELMEYRP